ncbi:O-antigen ligase family protein [Maioricimonas sp. JC845]|uniref:O-antigen ligase family protein n=1 Tax=Maioricimonas sp. JC845 TaxID=3232138 RepID=UPI00345740AF
MTLTLAIWLGLYGLFAVLMFRRAAWGIPLYLMTYYASPHFWWWGKSLTGTVGDRINLFTGLLFATGALMQASGSRFKLSAPQRRVSQLLLLYAINATVVHFAFAANAPRSLNGMTMIWKQVVISYLFMLVLRSRKDLQILLGTIIVGSMYIAFEVVINERGHFSASRLEGVGAPGASESNYLAGLLLLAIPLAGSWLLIGNWKQRLVSIPALALTFEVILRCNSRGAFLAAIAGGGYLLLAARGRARTVALVAMVLAGAGAMLMINDQDILNRFSTTFASGEERDHSASERLNFWGAAVRMIAENPLGSGAEAAFKSDLGARYIQTFFPGHKAVHQGYLDIAAGWGIQGFLLYMGTIAYCWILLRRTTKAARNAGDATSAFIGVCIETALVVQLASSVFISSLDGEWFFWLYATCTTYATAYAPARNRSVEPAWARWNATQMFSPPAVRWPPTPGRQ